MKILKWNVKSPDSPSTGIRFWLTKFVNKDCVGFLHLLLMSGKCERFGMEC